MFIDKIKIKVKAGNGGNGVVAFHKEKYVDKGGPSGGDGGKGGDVYFIGKKNISTLSSFKYKRNIKAQNGENGASKKRTGKSGEDIYIDVPLGSVFKNEKNEFLGEIIDENQTILIANGGKGGKGNARFASSRNQAPRIAYNGDLGEELQLEIELKLLADVGLIGMPSAGKSTLLSVLTNAKPKIGSYDFTTLSPNLGVVSIVEGFDFVIADLPGLIKGASEGKGLGLEFLRHIERCRVLVHVLDVSSRANHEPKEAYFTVLRELENYGLDLEKRPQVVLLNKIDNQIKQDDLNKLEDFFKKEEITYFKTSSFTKDGLVEVVKKVNELINKTPRFPIENEKMKLYTLEKKDDNSFKVSKQNNMFFVEGDVIDRVINKINFSHQQGFNKIISIFNNLGVEKELKKQGVKNGDTVVIGKIEFEYANEDER